MFMELISNPMLHLGTLVGCLSLFTALAPIVEPAVTEPKVERVGVANEAPESALVELHGGIRWEDYVS